jgi:hypothetical protein
MFYQRRISLWFVIDFVRAAACLHQAFGNSAFCSVATTREDHRPPGSVRAALRRGWARDSVDPREAVGQALLIAIANCARHFGMAQAKLTRTKPALHLLLSRCGRMELSVGERTLSMPSVFLDNNPP